MTDEKAVDVVACAERLEAFQRDFYALVEELRVLREVRSKGEDAVKVLTGLMRSTQSDQFSEDGVNYASTGLAVDMTMEVLLNLLNDPRAQNHASFQIKKGDEVKAVVTVQRPTGKTPIELLREANNTITALEAKLHADELALTRADADLLRELLRHTPTFSDGGVEFAKEEIQARLSTFLNCPPRSKSPSFTQHTTATEALIAAACAWEDAQDTDGNVALSEAVRAYRSGVSASWGSPAETEALNVLAGVRILQVYRPDADLVGLDKCIVCDGPDPDGGELGEEERKKLADLGWEWDLDQEAWSFYTGH